MQHYHHALTVLLVATLPCEI